MKFTIEKDVFLKGLGRSQAVVEKRNTIPVLSNVLIQAENGEIVLSASDLEIGLRSHYPAVVSAPGRITVPAKKLFEIVKELPDSEVSFTVKENDRVELCCGKAIFNVAGLEADQFPVFPSVNTADGTPLTSALCQELISKTLPSMGQDDTKANLCGLKIQVVQGPNGSVLQVVTTDGHRMTMINKPLEGTASNALKEGLLLPRKGVLELKRLADEGEDELVLTVLDNNLIASKGSTLLYMRLIEANFPDCNRIIPQSHSKQAIVDIDSLLHALRRMMILSSEKTRGVTLNFKAGSLALSASNSDLGNASEDLDIEYQGDAMTVSFNARYLIDILQVQDGLKLKMQFTEAVAPGLFMPEKEDGYQAVIMPMRL
jgi:DNA polymerase-3 subunit beta